MLLRPSIVIRKNYICHVCRALIWQRCSYSQEFDKKYSAEQKQKILQVMNESDVGGLSRYDVTKSRIKYIKQWKNNNGNLKSLSDVDMVEGFSDKYAKKLFDSILNGPASAEEQDTKPSKRIKGQILQPLLSESVGQSCKSVLALHITVNSVCWTLIDRSTYEVVEWEYHAIDYPDSKRLQIIDIMAIAWRVTQSFPEADLYVMKAEATTLRAAGSDPSSPKVLAVNLQKAQMVAMIVALINARSNHLNKNNEDGTAAEDFENKVYFLRPTLPYSLTMEKQLTELVAEPSGEFKKFIKMSLEDFEYLLLKVSPVIMKQDTQLRKAIPARVRLAVTLRFLVSGDSYESLHFLFKISPQIISKIIPEVCLALNQVLKEEIKIPSTAEEWLDIENGFARIYPRAIGSIDGKHITLECPNKSGSEYYNYKKTFSIVLLALVDSSYNFIFADIGSQGRISDGGVFRNSLLWQKICTNALNIPEPSPLPGSNVNVPYVFLGDGAFALTEHVMKPYPGNHECGSPKRLFNQTLSRARVVVENTFGILVTKFRVFKKPFQLSPEKVSLITMTCILLHNYLRRSNTSLPIYTPPGTIDMYDNNDILIHPGTWRQEMQRNCAVRDLPHVTRRPASNAREIREEFSNYFFALNQQQDR